jgi:lipopolysaccharide transport system permease protein
LATKNAGALRGIETTGHWGRRGPEAAGEGVTRTPTTYDSGERGLFAGLGELWEYRGLLYFMVWRDLKVRYKQTALGALWAIIVPTFTMVVFTVVFGRLAKVPSDDIPYPLFSFAALLPWTYFSTGLTQTGNCLVANTDLITKVYFPRLVLPISSVVSGLVDFVLASLMLVVLMVYYQVVPTFHLLLWPLFMIPIVAFALGAGMFLAVVNVRFRDIKYTIPFLIQIGLFLTPVIYPTSIVPERFKVVAALNPMAGVIEGMRSALFPERPIDWTLVGISTVMAFGILTAATVYFLKREKQFADII